MFLSANASQNCVSDLMPGIDGLEVLGRMRRIDPGVNVIACSGLQTSQREIEVLVAGARAFLPKPYSDNQLLDAFASVLNPVV